MCDQDTAVILLTSSLIASVLFNLACLFWICKEPAPLPAVSDTLGRTLLTDEIELYTREQVSEPQTGQEI